MTRPRTGGPVFDTSWAIDRGFIPGALVRADRPDFIVPREDQRKVGLVLGVVEAYKEDNVWATTQVRVAWFGPDVRAFVTLEPDHRIRVVV